MSDGTLSVRRRELRNEDITSQPLLDASFVVSDANFDLYNARVKGNNQDFGEIRLHMQSSRKLKEYDKFLKNFKYSAALDVVLKKVRISFRSTIFLYLYKRRTSPLQQHLR